MSIELVDYSDKSWALRGEDTKKYRDEIKKLTKIFNPYLKDPDTGKRFGGWIIAKIHTDKLNKLLEGIESGAIAGKEPVEGEEEEEKPVPQGPRTPSRVITVPVAPLKAVPKAVPKIVAPAPLAVPVPIPPVRSPAPVPPPRGVSKAPPRVASPSRAAPPRAASPPRAAPLPTVGDGVRCIAPTKSGERCKKPPMKGSACCYIHQDVCPTK